VRAPCRPWQVSIIFEGLSCTATADDWHVGTWPPGSGLSPGVDPALPRRRPTTWHQAQHSCMLAARGCKLPSYHASTSAQEALALKPDTGVPVERPVRSEPFTYAIVGIR